MPLFSAFTPFGHLAFSGRKSHGESIYAALKDNFGDTFDLDSAGSHQGARLYALAMCLADAQYQLDRAGNNRNPETATELLALLEHDYQVSPPPTATLPQRRAVLAALRKISQGNSRGAIEAALTILLGSDFIEYRTTALADVVTWPSSPGTVGVFARPDAQKKAFKLTEAISITGIPLTVHYTAIGGSEAPVPSETYCVDPDSRNPSIEQITISTATATTITATFEKSHEPGACMVRPLPLWVSNQRTDVAVVSLAAATDPETRRKVNELLGKALRSVSQWYVVHNLGVFTSDDPVLGLPDCVPVS